MRGEIGRGSGWRLMRRAWSGCPHRRPDLEPATIWGWADMRLDNAWRLDEVLRMARNDGIYLMFCLGTYGEFTESGYFNEGSWVSNPYNARNGGPCDRPADFWTNPRGSNCTRGGCVT